MTEPKSQNFANAITVDSVIIESAQAGDKQAMALIYKNYSHAVYGLLYRMLWHKETAQELMQDTFIDVMTKLPSYRADSNLYAWIRKIAVNNCLMYFRKNKTKLQELLQSHNCELPLYDTTELNKKNRISFRTYCKIIEHNINEDGTGSNKRKSQQEAALKALSKLSEIFKKENA